MISCQLDGLFSVDSVGSVAEMQLSVRTGVGDRGSGEGLRALRGFNIGVNLRSSAVDLGLFAGDLCGPPRPLRLIIGIRMG